MVSRLALRKATQPSLKACSIQLHRSDSGLEGPEFDLRSSRSGLGASRAANVLEFVLSEGYTFTDTILSWGVACQGITLAAPSFFHFFRCRLDAQLTE